MKTPFTIIICSIALLVLAGCSSLDKRSQKLQLGMTKEAAVQQLDADHTVAAARTEPDGSTVEVLKYPDKKKDLYLYFRNGKLTQWGDPSALDAMPPAATPAR